MAQASDASTPMTILVRRKVKPGQKKDYEALKPSIVLMTYLIMPRPTPLIARFIDPRTKTL